MLLTIARQVLFSFYFIFVCHLISLLFCLAVVATEMSVLQAIFHHILDPHVNQFITHRRNHGISLYFMIKTRQFCLHHILVDKECLNNEAY